MQNEAELEQMVNLLALSADIMRKLAKAQQGHEREAISLLADDIERVADKLVDVLYPSVLPPQ